jgi:hypothetical protein
MPSKKTGSFYLPTFFFPGKKKTTTVFSVTSPSLGAFAFFYSATNKQTKPL